MATASPARRDATDSLLDAAEALLVDVGYAAITVRKLAERAGVNQGLVHYYFGSMEEVFLQTLERFTDRLIERQTRLYAAELPFVDKWRTAMGYLTADFETGYQKVWLELQAMAWNHPEMRDRVATVLDRWQDVLLPAFESGWTSWARPGALPARRDRDPRGDVQPGPDARTPVGRDPGHAELLATIDRWLTEQETRPAPSEDRWRRNMRAREPDRDGFAERDGVKLSYEVFGDDPGRPTVVLLPTWQIVHSHHWKAQVPYLARHFRVMTFDGRGSGRSSRPVGRRGLHRPRVRGRRRGGSRRHRHRPRRPRRPIVRRDLGRAHGGRPPRPGQRHRRPRPVLRARGGATPPRFYQWDGVYDTTEGGPSTTGATGWRVATTTSCSGSSSG